MPTRLSRRWLNVVVWFDVMCNVTDIYQPSGRNYWIHFQIFFRYKPGKGCRFFYQTTEWKNLRNPHVSNPWARLETPTFWIRMTFNQTTSEISKWVQYKDPDKAKHSARMNEENENLLNASYHSVRSLLTSHLLPNAVKIKYEQLLCLCF
jgi:hypothetical protein